MSARWILTAVLLASAGGCLEGNPQPSPMKDTSWGGGGHDEWEPLSDDAANSLDDVHGSAEGLSGGGQVDGAQDVCLPNCEARECGDDGCGGSCGACLNWCNPTCAPIEVPFEDSNLCMEPEGFCAQVCCPNCCDTECGDDGCGGACGMCRDDQICMPGGFCAEPTCVPGGEILWDPVTTACCEGLLAVPQAVPAVPPDCPPDGKACCYACKVNEQDPAICLPVGDKLCSATENVCNSRDCFCHDDPDLDGIVTEIDNCPTVVSLTVSDLDADGIGDDCDTDLDGDGSENAFDCAPKDPAIYPGAEADPFNGVDDDCDGEVDEDEPPVGVCPDEPPPEIDNCPQVCNFLQADYDNDSQGDACDADDDADLSLDSEDCAPYNPDIHPGAQELCNGLDDNCSGQTDEDCPCIPEFTSFIDPFPDLLCCPGLVPVHACNTGSGIECEDGFCLWECGCPEPLGFHCAPCGNGTCDEGESPCNCTDCVL